MSQTPSSHSRVLYLQRKAGEIEMDRAELLVKSDQNMKVGRQFTGFDRAEFHDGFDHIDADGMEELDTVFRYAASALGVSKPATHFGNFLLHHIAPGAWRRGAPYVKQPLVALIGQDGSIAEYERYEAELIVAGFMCRPVEVRDRKGGGARREDWASFASFGANIEYFTDIAQENYDAWMREEETKRIARNAARRANRKRQ